MNFELITQDAQLEELCQRLPAAPWVAFDTEFVSEYSYYPELCLVQVAIPQGLWAIDPYEVDLSAFWQALCEGEHLTIVHAGREELLFCHRAVGATPRHWFDAQLAAGMVGLEYPAAYAKIILRLLDERLGKGETRTDWRRRPLTRAQLEYALNDVLYLNPVREVLTKKLEGLGRAGWFADETEGWRNRLLEVDPDRWRRVAGSGNLSGSKLAVVKALWQWREAEAQRRNVPVKRILRDDLIVELARRNSADPEQIREIRGMQRRDLLACVPALSRCIRQASGESVERERSGRPDLPKQIDAIAQFLNAALGTICRERSISPQIVGTMQDVKDLVAHQWGYRNGEGLPKLLDSWRREFVGDLLLEGLAGRLSLRIGDQQSEFPIAIERT